MPHVPNAKDPNRNKEVDRMKKDDQRGKEKKTKEKGSK